MSYHFVWLVWASAFLIPWAALYCALPALRREMLRVSLATSLLGLTEPIFVPEYWNPPSLFDLAQRSGFDVESFVFCFAIGGVGAVMYDAMARRRLRPVPHPQRHSGRHRFHYAALALPYLAFVPLYVLPWNPIYPSIACLTLGAAANVACRPDLARGSAIGGLLFLGYYALFMLALAGFAPGYIQLVWNLQALSGVLIDGIPIEELAFGFAFGAYWAGMYEHFTWRRSVRSSLAQQAS